MFHTCTAGARVSYYRCILRVAPKTYFWRTPLEGSAWLFVSRAVDGICFLSFHLVPLFPKSRLSSFVFHLYQSILLRFIRRFPPPSGCILWLHLYILRTCVQDLPEVFENDMAPWMEGFHTYLEAYANPLLDQPEGSEAPGPIERVQVSYCSLEWKPLARLVFCQCRWPRAALEGRGEGSSVGGGLACVPREEATYRINAP